MNIYKHIYKQELINESLSKLESNTDIVLKTSCELSLIYSV